MKLQRRKNKVSWAALNALLRETSDEAEVTRMLQDEVDSGALGYRIRRIRGRLKALRIEKFEREI